MLTKPVEQVRGSHIKPVRDVPSHLACHFSSLNMRFVSGTHIILRLFILDVAHVELARCSRQPDSPPGRSYAAAHRFDNA